LRKETTIIIIALALALTLAQFGMQDHGAIILTSIIIFVLLVSGTCVIVVVAADALCVFDVVAV
jgi:hypothetical protein